MKKKNVRLSSDVNKLKKANTILPSSLVESGYLAKSVSNIYIKTDFDFDRYQGFYTYQWKVSHCILQIKLLELEEQARKLKLELEIAAKESYLSKVKEHDEIQTSWILSDLDAFKTLFFKEVTQDEKLSFNELDELFSLELSADELKDPYSISFRDNTPESVIILISRAARASINLDEDESPSGQHKVSQPQYVLQINQQFVEKFDFFEYKSVSDVLKNIEKFSNLYALQEIIKKCLQRPQKLEYI